MLDFIVIGGGMVGSAIALGLAQQGKRGLIIERHLPKPFSTEQLPDIRMSALSLGSVSLLTSLGAWQHIESMRYQPYSRLSVCEGVTSDVTHFDASSIDQTWLGYFVENRVTQLALHKALKDYDSVEWKTEVDVEQIDPEQGDIHLSDGSRIQAELIIGADGAQSRVRQLAKIGQTGWQYGQQAMGIIVKTPFPSTHETWQRFRPQGPIAYLPMHDQYAALIWYDQADSISHLMSLDEPQLKEALVSAYGAAYLGLEIINKARFPLARAHANQYVKGKVVLAGDAAHTINPLAGQGVNIGFKDVEQLLAALEGQSMPSADQLRQRYERPRRRANALMMSTMDAFYLGFSNDILPLKLARNALLKVVDNAGLMKQHILKYAVGL
ncbi:FAD-dependent monooxygenase [Alteromonas facilis]|uniref:FAD-dependent monooxygenase n=1 Tax=Alteromonas facilis TaxID=2048004 RepID=UPI000C29296B|nr:FAD-dependent monooxygenase [Alteromonas facilis]